MLGSNIDAIAHSLKARSNEIVYAKDEQAELDAFNKMLDTFDAVCEAGIKKNIQAVMHFLYETTDRVRSPKDMHRLLMKRISLGTKEKGITKVSKTLQGKTSSLGNKLSGPENLGTTLSVPSINVNLPSNQNGSAPSKEKESEPTTEATLRNKCYNEMINKCKINIAVDRILENYNKLSRRFNVDKVLFDIDESFRDDIDIYCDLFDTWPDEQMSRKAKFNVALETALYIKDKHNLFTPRMSIIESIVDYTLFKYYQEDAIFSTVYEWLCDNTLISEEDIKPYKEMYEDINGIRPVGMNSVAYIIESETKNPDKNLKASIKNFKASEKKTPDGLKKVISNRYNKTPEQITEETPKFFDILRYFAVVGAFAIAPIAGVVTFMTDQFLKRDFRRPEAAKMVKAYEKEIDKVDRKIDKTQNEEKRKKLKEYKDTLYSNLAKLKDYEDELYTDEENQQREDEKYNEIADNFDLDDAMAFLEMSAVVCELSMNNELENIIQKNIDNFVNGDLIDDITKFAIQSEGFINAGKLKAIYEVALMDTKHQKPSTARYVTMDTLKMNIDQLDKYMMSEEVYDEDINEMNKVVSYYMFAEALQALDKESSSPYFLETSFMNTLNIAKTKIQAAWKTLTDKQKKITSTIDSSLKSFKKSVDDFFNKGAREQVLSGSILPSASKILKTAITSGIGFLIHPALGVIALLGTIGVSKLAEDKQRKLILDELDTELQMVDKYIDEADRRGKLKDMKNLLNTKKRLQREKARIKYKLAQHGEKPLGADLKQQD